LAFSNYFEDGYEYELLIYFSQAVHQGSGYLRRLIHLGSRWWMIFATRT
jgi:hypothetical protein